MKKRIISLLTAIILCFCYSHALAQEPLSAIHVREVLTAGKGSSFVAYPVVEMQDAAIAERINSVIYAESRIEAYLRLLDGIGENGTGLQVNYEILSGDDSDCFSVVLSAKGRMLEGRPSQVWYPFTFDAHTGERVLFEDLFVSQDQAISAMEAYITDFVEPLMSDYAENRSFIPIPVQSMAVVENGICIYYDYDEVSCLSGYAGSVLIPFRVVQDQLADQSLVLDQTVFAEKLLASAAMGFLPGLPVTLDMPLEDVTQAYRQSFDPGIWKEGIYVELEDARFLGSVVCADAEDGAVTGIYTKGLLFPVLNAEMTYDEALVLFGQPERVEPIGNDASESALLGTGRLLIYKAGPFALGIQCDDNDHVSGYILTKDLMREE